jgi:hypothetical protein
VRNECLPFGCTEDFHYVVQVYVYNCTIMGCTNKLLGLKSEVPDINTECKEDGYMCQ